MNVLVLAGGNDQAALMQELRSKFPGVKIVLVDMASNVVASKYADEHVVVSTMDIGAVKKVAKEKKVDYVMTACGDQPLLTMAVVSEELGLPCYLTKRQVLNLTNKMYMKRLMWDNGIPTSRFKTFGLNEVLDDTGLRYPLIVKPVDSNGSKGVRKVFSYSELKEFASLAFSFSLSKTIIVEEFKEGVEVSSDFYVVGGKVHTVMMSQLNKFGVDVSTSVIYQSIIPPDISEEAIDKIEKVAKRIAEVFEIGNSPLLIQSIVSGNDVNVIEFSARLGGGAKYKSIQNVTGFNVLRANLESMLGMTPNIEIHNRDCCFSRCHFYTQGGVFSQIKGLNELQKEGVVDEFVLTKPYGVQVNAPKSSSDRVASVFLHAKDRETLIAKVHFVVDEVEIYDDKGRDIFERNMYL